MTHDLDMRRKRLIWRASHRGIREMDLILGGYARRHVAAMDEARLAELDAVIAIPDHDLYDWITGRAAVPASARNRTLDELLKFTP